MLIEWTPLSISLGGLFGAQKPNTGFGSTFGAPASSATTGFSGLGTFTPAGSKNTFETNASINVLINANIFFPFIGSAFGTFGQTSTFNKPAGGGFPGFGTTSTAPTLSGGFGGLGTNTLGLYVLTLVSYL